MPPGREPSPASPPVLSGIAEGVGGGRGSRTVTTTVAPDARDEGAPADTVGSHGAAVRPAVWGNIPPRNQVFTGRRELLENLDRGLRGGMTAVLPHTLHGMGGVGKSQLALEYVYRHAAEFDIVWWISAERPTQVVKALVELAQRLGLPVGGEAITAVPAVLEALRTGIPHQKWLLVFDNAESPESIQEYFPGGPGGPAGSILVTSRNPQWNTLAHPLEVDVFERDESVQLLQRRNPDLSTADALRLADVLGDLPLAVEQASAWRAETGMPVDEYLRLFEEKRVELMTVSRPALYEETVATAWNVSLDYLERKSAAALQLLQVCAYFAPEPIARSIFSATAVDPIAPELDLALTDPLRLGRAIREINRYSLAKIDHRTNSIQMHRLVQAVLIARMTEEQRVRMRHGAHMLLAGNAPKNPQDPDHWPRYGELYPHVVVSQAVDSPSRRARQMVFGFAEYLYWWGDHEGARSFAQRTYEQWRDAYGDADPQTVMLGRHLRSVLWVMGRYTESADLSAHLLAVLERDTDADSVEELLRVKGQVASDLRAQGDFRGALAIDQEVYDRAVHVCGVDDPETLRHAHNLGVSLRANGEYQRALTLDTDTWQRKREMYGEQSLSALLTESSIAYNRRELGEYLTSARLLQSVVEKYRQSVGESNPFTQRAIARLGVALRKAGDHQGAAELTGYARRTLTERYGAHSPDALQAALNLSVDLRQLGDLQEAYKLGERTRTLYVETFGADHPHAMAASLNLAITLRLLSRVEAARELNDAAFAYCVERLGEFHPSTLVCRANLASDLFALGEVAAALAMDEVTVEAAERVLGPDHPTSLVIKTNLAADLRAVGRREEAETKHREALEGLVERLGAEHPACTQTQEWRRANCDLEPSPL
nr:FxSxx-COOH system tetratricopeptide repeat protein [Streptomyces sp. SID3343]